MFSILLVVVCMVEACCSTERQDVFVVIGQMRGNSTWGGAQADVSFTIRSFRAQGFRLFRVLGFRVLVI